MPSEEKQIQKALVQAAEAIAAEDDFTTLDLHEIAAAADVAPEQIEAHVQQNGALAFELSISTLKQVRDEAMALDTGIVARMEHYVTGGMEIMVNSSLALVKGWITDIVDEKHDRGMRRLVWGWNVLADILRSGIADGELTEETPVAKLTGIVLAEFYGVIFMWSVLQGSLDAVGIMRDFCLHILPDLLAPYMSVPAADSGRS